MMGEPIFSEHLKYEVEKYAQEGLRDDNIKEMKIFLILRV